jgi:hypothetical protein
MDLSIRDKKPCPDIVLFLAQRRKVRKESKKLGSLSRRASGRCAAFPKDTGTVCVKIFEQNQVQKPHPGFM